jgi:hypothetical protein
MRGTIAPRSVCLDHRRPATMSENFLADGSGFTQGPMQMKKVRL